MVGDSNADFDLVVVEFDGSNVQKTAPVIKRLQPSLRQRFPWAEYMPRAGWIPDGSKYPNPTCASLSLTNTYPRVWVQLLDRKQQKWALITIDAASFSASASEATQQPGADVHLIREETTPYWINVRHMKLCVLPF